MSGDEEALVFFIDSYKKLVFHVAGKLIEDSDDLEDACQEIFIKIYENIGSFKHGCKLSTWIAKISYNHACNLLKKRKKTVSFSKMNFAENEEIFLEELSVKSSQIESGFNGQKEDCTQMIEKCLERLHPVQREIISLYHTENFSYEEISYALSMPLGTVKNYLFRARKNLKDMVLRTQEAANEAH